MYNLLAVHKFFLSAEGGVRILIKVNSKADRSKESRKSFTKN